MRNHITKTTVFQPPSLVGEIIEASDLFCSALYHRAAHEIPLVMDGEKPVEFPLSILASEQHQIVAKVLLAHIETGTPATRASVRRVVSGIGAFACERILNPHNRDLVTLLPFMAESGRNLHIIGRQLVRLNRRRQIASRLWQRLRGLAGNDRIVEVENDRTTARPISKIQVTRMPRISGGRR